MANDFNHEQTYRRMIWRFYRKVATDIQAIINMNLDGGQVRDYDKLTSELDRYAQALELPASLLWGKVIKRQAATLAKDFKAVAGLKIDPQSAQMRALVERLVREKVDLIKTLPRNSAVEAQKMSAEIALSTGKRHETLVAKIQGLADGYPEYAARRIARTEVARTQSQLVQAQAQSIGVNQYVWQTVEDEAVRESHRAMNGKICSFDDPPEVEPGKFFHPGCIYNCRCVAMPLLPRLIEEDK